MRRALAGIVIAGALLLPAAAAHAAAFTVTDTSDSAVGTNCDGHPTTCTLREAVESSISPGADTITVNPGHYTLTNGELRAFGADMTEITGTGTAADVVIDADGDSRVLRFDNAATLRHLTVTGGQVDSGIFSGAGILADGALTLDDVVVSDNFVGAPAGSNATGGGVWVGVSLTVPTGSRATVTGNGVSTVDANARGGGVYVNGGATSFDLSRVDVDGNLAQTGSGLAEGGGIGVGPTATGTLTITGRVTDNSAVATSGGMVYAGGAMAPDDATLTGASFTGNTAAADAANAAAGGLWVGGALTASGGVQFVGNTVDTDSTWSARGGAIYLDNAASGTLTDITLRGNRATSAGGIASGGGIFSVAANPVQLTRALLDANQAISSSGAISQAYGGGLATSLSSSTRIEDSRVTGNLVESDGTTYGGGADAIGTLQVFRTTFDANRAVSHRTSGGDAALGGGAYAHATSSLQNTTFTGNSATTTTSSGTTGGGGLAIDASLAVSGSTISGNTSHRAGNGGVGGGIFADGHPVDIGGSILSGNTSDSGPDCSGTPVDASGGGNVLPVALGCITVAFASDRQTDTPGLGALGDHDGFAPTMLLDPTSPAVGRNSVACPTQDERGFPRGSAPCDAGAVEMRPASLTATPAALAFGSVATDATGTLPVTLTNSGDFSAPVAISGPDAASFALSGCPAAILGVTSCVAAISFAPRALGAASATLTPAVALTGTGVPAPSRGSIPACRDLDLGSTTGGPVVARLDCSPGVWDWAIVARPEHGTLSPIGDRGEVTYTPDPGYRGEDRFRYIARGGAGRSNVATALVRVDGTPPTTTPTPAPVARSCTATVRLNPRGTRFVRVRVSGAPATVKRSGQVWRATVTVTDGHATLHLSGRRPDGGLTKRTLSVSC
jgi:hypothetical protein